jgi:pimeloyl-ACP methyl ester carboxylesterase
MSLHLRTVGMHPSLAIAEGGVSGGPLLLLLHGLTRGHGDWSPLLPRLVNRWRVIAVDQRGHGCSARAERYLVSDYAADAVRLVRDEIGGPVMILGHSLGAMVAAAVAAELPDLVQGIVMEDPPFHAMGERIAGTAWQSQFSGMRDAALRGGTVDDLATAIAAIRLPKPDGSSVRFGDIRDHAAIRWSADCLSRLDPETLTPVIAGRWLDGYDAVRLASAIQCPVRLLQADPLSGGGLSDADRDAFATAAPDCFVERFPGVGHLIHWVEPARVADAIDAMWTARRRTPTIGLSPREQR